MGNMDQERVATRVFEHGKVLPTLRYVTIIRLLEERSNNAYSIC